MTSKKMTAWLLSAFREVCQKLADGQQVCYALLLTVQKQIQALRILE